MSCGRPEATPRTGEENRVGEEESGLVKAPGKGEGCAFEVGAEEGCGARDQGHECSEKHAVEEAGGERGEGRQR